MRILVRHRDRRELVGPAVMLLALVATQVTLGAYVIWTAKQFIVNSAHVATGAMVLGTSLVLTLRAHRSRFASPPKAASKGAAYDYNVAYVRRPGLQVRRNPSAGANT
jgi:heme A synthase